MNRIVWKHETRSSHSIEFTSYFAFLTARHLMSSSLIKFSCAPVADIIWWGSISAPTSKLAHNHFTNRWLHSLWMFFKGRSHKNDIYTGKETNEVTNVIRDLLKIESTFLCFGPFSHLLQEIDCLREHWAFRTLNIGIVLKIIQRVRNFASSLLDVPHDKSNASKVHSLSGRPLALTFLQPCW